MFANQKCCSSKGEGFHFSHQAVLHFYPSSSPSPSPSSQRKPIMAAGLASATWAKSMRAASSLSSRVAHSTFSTTAFIGTAAHPTHPTAPQFPLFGMQLNNKNLMIPSPPSLSHIASPSFPRTTATAHLFNPFVIPTARATNDVILPPHRPAAVGFPDNSSEVIIRKYDPPANQGENRTIIRNPSSTPLQAEIEHNEQEQIQYQCESTKRKRRHKINKHKRKKMRKRHRAQIKKGRM